MNRRPVHEPSRQFRQPQRLWDDVAHVVAGREQKIRFADTLFAWLAGRA